MEDELSLLDEILILKVKKLCCAAYEKELKRQLSRLDGLDGEQSIAIRLDKNLVAVRGRVNANAVLQIITDSGKTAKIIHYPTKYTNIDSSDYDHHPKNSGHPQERPQNNKYQQQRNRGPDESRYQNERQQIPRRENNQQNMNHCYHPDESRYNRNAYQGHPNANYRQQRSYSFEENHVCEDYIPPMNEHLCRNYDHHGMMGHNMRPMFSGNVPLGHVPYHAGLHNRSLYPPRVGPSLYGFGSGRPVRGFGNYGFYGHGIGRGYSRMM